MKRLRYSKLIPPAVPAEHRFKPMRCHSEFDDDAALTYVDANCANHSECCICAAVCLPSAKSSCMLGHLQAHVRCVKALLAPASLPSFLCNDSHSSEFSLWPCEVKRSNNSTPALLQAAAEPSAVFTICLALLQQRNPPSAPAVLPDNFIKAAELLSDSERPWPTFPYISALQAALCGCEVFLQPCNDSTTRLFFKGGLLDSAQMSRIGEFILPPVQCSCLGCKACCNFSDFFKLGWLVQARACLLEEGMGVVSSCALHAFSSLPPVLSRIVAPSPPRINVDFPTVDLYECVQDEGEGRCGVCLSSASTSSDALLLCAGCGVACHQSCCEVNEVPAGNWYCHVCGSGLQRERHCCCVCPVAFGVLQYAAPPDLFIHTACASALLGTRPSPSAPVRGYSAAAAESNSQQFNPCCGCGSREGLRVSCRGRGCMLSAHAVCALAQGWLQQPHSKWLCPAHNDNPRAPRDSAFEHKVGGVDGASRIIAAMGLDVPALDHPATVSPGGLSGGAADSGNHLDLDARDVSAVQGVHRPVNWTEVGALPYRAPVVLFPTSFSVIDAVFKLVLFPPSDIINFDFLAQSHASAPANSSSSAACTDLFNQAWTFEEDRQLLLAIQGLGCSSWSAVAAFMSTPRSRKECKKRWCNLVRDRGSLCYSRALEKDFLLAASRSSAETFVFDEAPPCGSGGTPLHQTTRKNAAVQFSSNSIIYTSHLTPMQRFAVIVLAMMAQRQLQATGLVTQIAWDCIINAFNALLDARSCCNDSSAAQGDASYVARSSLSGSFAVLSWLHRRACAGGGGSSRLIVVIGKTFFDSGTISSTAASISSLKSAFSSSEFNKIPIPIVTVSLDALHELAINKNDAIVVLHGDRCSTMDVEQTIMRAMPPDYNQRLSHILPVVGLSDVLGPHTRMQSVTVHQCAAVISCLLAAALRGVHIFEVPSFLCRPEAVQDAVLNSAAASARIVEVMIRQFKSADGDSAVDVDDSATYEGADGCFDNDCIPSKQRDLTDAQTPAAAACRICFCIATNGSLPITSSVLETRSIVFRTVSAAVFAWKCSCDSLASWMLQASEVDLFWKRASQHFVSMMRHPGLQADMALCRFGDQPRHIGKVCVEAMGVLFAPTDSDFNSTTHSNSTPSFSLGAGGRIVRSFWDAATGRHRCVWVTECLHNHLAPVFFCYARSGAHEMFVGCSAAEAWAQARNRILASCKDGYNFIDMTSDVSHWLQFQDSRIVAEAHFLILSDRYYRQSTSSFCYARSPGFVFAPIPPIESACSTETVPSPTLFNRILFPAATRHGVVLVDLNENGYIDLKNVGNQSSRRVPVTLDDGACIQSLGYYSVAYAAAGGHVSVPSCSAPLLNFKSSRSIRQGGLDPVEFVNSVIVQSGNVVYKIVAKTGFQILEFFGNSEVDAFNSLLQHRSFAPILRTVASNAAVWFGTSSALVNSARELAARAADAALVAISSRSTPGSPAFVRLLPCDEPDTHASRGSCVKTGDGVHHSLSGVRYKAINHSRGRQVDCDAVVFAQAKGSFAVIQHRPSSRFPSKRVIRQGPSILSPSSTVLLELDYLDSSFELTVHEDPPVTYVGDSASFVMQMYFESVAECRSCQIPDMLEAVKHWTGESAGLLGYDALRSSSKGIIFQAPDVIDVDASFLYKLPDQGLCSTEEDYEVKILSFGMGRVFARHASGSHCPLPGFCSVTKDREGRVYVYFCQDDDVHWMHMLENMDGVAVLSIFARSFDSMQLIVRNSSLDLPSTDLFGFERARQKFLLPLSAQVSYELELDDFVDHDLSCPAEGDLDFGLAMFDIQDESLHANASDRGQISLNSSYPNIGEQFQVTGGACSSTFQIQSAGSILKGKKIVYVNGVPISHSFHSTGTFTLLNGRSSSFECTTLYTSSHGNAMIKLVLGEEGVVLRFTQETFSPGNLFSYFGVSRSTEPGVSSGAGADLMLKLVGLAHVFTHRRVLSVIGLTMPSYVVSVIRSVPSPSDAPSTAIDLDVFLSTPYCCNGITVEQWGSARQDLIVDGLIVPIGFRSIRTLPDGRLVRCQVEEVACSPHSPKAASILFSVSQICAGEPNMIRHSAPSAHEAWFAFLGLDLTGCLHGFLERCGYNRCNGMVLFGLGVTAVQSLIHFICKMSVWQRELDGGDNSIPEEEEDRTDAFVSPFAACEKRQSRRFSAAINRHTQTFLTWLESRRPLPPLKHSVLGDLAPSQQIEHQDAAELWKNVIQRDYGDYKEMVQRDFT